MSNAIDPQEAAKLQLSHSLGLRRLVIEKLLLGALVGLAAFAASLVFEKQKQSAADTRYFLEKRLEAGTEIRQALSGVTAELLNLAVPSCLLSLDSARPPVEKLNEALKRLYHILNSSSLVLTLEYLDDASRVMHVFSGLASAPPQIPCDSRRLVTTLADYLTHRTREEVLPGSVPKWKGFAPSAVSEIEIEKIGTIDYAEKNRELWRQWMKKPASN